jgi:hypothetical protein
MSWISHLASNLGLEIVAFHPNSGGTWRINNKTAFPTP